MFAQAVLPYLIQISIVNYLNFLVVMKSKKAKADDSAVDNDHVQVIEKKKRKRRVDKIDDVDVGVTKHADKSVSNKKRHRVPAETVDDRVAVVDTVNEVTFASFGLDERLLKVCLDG